MLSKGSPDIDMKTRAIINETSQVLQRQQKCRVWFLASTCAYIYAYLLYSTLLSLPQDSNDLWHESKRTYVWSNIRANLQYCWNVSLKYQIFEHLYDQRVWYTRVKLYFIVHGFSMFLLCANWFRRFGQYIQSFSFVLFRSLIYIITKSNQNVVLKTGNDL